MFLGFSRRFVISCERCENLPFRKLPVVCVTSHGSGA